MLLSCPPPSRAVLELRTGGEGEHITEVLSQSVLLQLPVLQAVLPVEVGPGDVVRAGLEAVLNLPVLGVQLVALSALNTVLADRL